MRILAGTLLLLVSQILPAQEPAKPAASPATESQSSGVACAQPASAAQVRRLMELAGSKKLMATVLDTTGRHLFEDLQKVRPDVPARAWEAALARLESPQVLQGLLDQVIPIYQRHFCADEVEQLIDFYQTPVGRKLSAEMPAIQKDAAEAGRSYMASISGELLRDVQQALKQGGKAPPTPPKPSQPAVFILSSGEKLESSHYLVSSDSVQVEQGDTQRTIPMSALNVDATIAANRARGIDLKIPSKGQIMLGF
jgi:hypothetical protein